MSGKAFERVERESHIMMVFINGYKVGDIDELTAPQVAKRLMLEPSHHVRKLLASLVSKGLLTMRGEYDERCNNLRTVQNGEIIPSAGTKYWYKLSEKSRKELDDASRDIPVKMSGVTVGQLRLF